MASAIESQFEDDQPQPWPGFYEALRRKGSGRGCSRWNDTSSIGIQLGFFRGNSVKSSALRSPDLAADEILASVDVFSLSGLMIKRMRKRFLEYASLVENTE